MVLSCEAITIFLLLGTTFAPRSASAFDLYDSYFQKEPAPSYDSYFQQEAGLKLFDDGYRQAPKGNFATSVTRCEDIDPPNTWRNVITVLECVDAYTASKSREPKYVNDVQSSKAPCGCTYHKFGGVDFWGKEGTSSNCRPEVTCTGWRDEVPSSDLGCLCRRIVPVESEKCLRSDTACHISRVADCSASILEDLGGGGCHHADSSATCVVPDSRLDECSLLWQYDHVAVELETDESLRSNSYKAVKKYRKIHGAVFKQERSILPLWTQTCAGYNWINGDKWEPDMLWQCSGCGCNSITDKTISVRGEPIEGYSGICFDVETETSTLSKSATACTTVFPQGVHKNFGTPSNYAGSEIHRLFFSIQQAFFDRVLNPESIQTNPNWIKTYGEGWEKEADHWPMIADGTLQPTTVSVDVDITLKPGWGRPVAYEDFPKLIPLGLYAPPGAVVTVSSPNLDGLESAARVVIGCHRNDPSGGKLSGRPGGIITRFDRLTHDTALVAGGVATVTNPFGGNIYIEVQKISAYGETRLEFTEVVKSPLYSLTQFQNTTCKEWEDVMGSDAEVPWADVLTDESLLQVPTKVLSDWGCKEIGDLAQNWQKRFNDLSKLTGHRKLRNRYVLYNQIDLTSKHGAGGIGEPMVNGPKKRYGNPIMSQNDWRFTDVLEETTMHELGHMQAFPMFPSEGESIVHLPYTYTALQTGKTLDEAFYESCSGRFDLKDAAISWFVTTEFQNGMPMNKENSPNNQIRYQHRGHAKYVDLARAFGWEPLISYFRAHQLLYEAYKMNADPTQSVEEQKKVYYDSKWPWETILRTISRGPSLEDVDWSEIAPFFDGANEDEYEMTPDTEVNIVLLSLAMEKNLLSYLELWGVNGIDNEARDKINELVGHLPVSSLCGIFSDYEEFLVESQKELTEHIQRVHGNYIEEISDSFLITWNPSVYNLDPRYAAGYYSQNDVFNASGTEKARSRIRLGKNVACGATSGPTNSPIKTKNNKKKKKTKKKKNKKKKNKKKKNKKKKKKATQEPMPTSAPTTKKK